MKLTMRSALLLAGGLAVFAAAPLRAATVAQMNLEQLVVRSESVFVGQVVGMSESRIAMGGGHVPAVTYRFRVSESFKGQVKVEKGVRIAEVKMLGTLKQVLSGQHPIQEFPVLRKGSEYLMIVAPAGPTGLTATMGLGQGCFTFEGKPEAKVAVNFVDNAGLFANMNVGLESGVAVPYSELARIIRSIVGGAQ